MRCSDPCGCSQRRQYRVVPPTKCWSRSYEAWWSTEFGAPWPIMSQRRGYTVVVMSLGIDSAECFSSAGNSAFSSRSGPGNSVWLVRSYGSGARHLATGGPTRRGRSRGRVPCEARSLRVGLCCVASSCHLLPRVRAQSLKLLLRRGGGQSATGVGPLGSNASLFPLTGPPIDPDHVVGTTSRFPLFCLVIA